LSALALAEALVIAGLLISGSSAFDARNGRLVIETEPSGAEVWLDGRHLGTTPLSLITDAGQRSLRIDSHGTSRTMTVDVAGGQVTHARVDFVKIADAAISAAPVPSVEPLTTLAAPPHVPIPNTESAPPRIAASAQTVEGGWIDTPAIVALDVFEGDHRLGNTTDGRLRLPSGMHALDFVNEELGVHGTLAIADAPADVTVDLRE